MSSHAASHTRISQVRPLQSLDEEQILILTLRGNESLVSYHVDQMTMRGGNWERDHTFYRHAVAFLVDSCTRLFDDPLNEHASKM